MDSNSPTVFRIHVWNSQSPQQIRQELLDSQLKVASLQDMSLQLLVNSQGSDCMEAKEKVHVIGNRLKLLLKEVTRDLRELAKTLDITSSQQVYLHLLYTCAVSHVRLWYLTLWMQFLVLEILQTAYYQLSPGAQLFFLKGQVWPTGAICPPLSDL